MDSPEYLGRNYSGMTIREIADTIKELPDPHMRETVARQFAHKFCIGMEDWNSFLTDCGVESTDLNGLPYRVKGGETRI